LSFYTKSPQHSVYFKAISARTPTPPRTADMHEVHRRGDLLHDGGPTHMDSALLWTMSDNNVNLLFAFWGYMCAGRSRLSAPRWAVHDDTRLGGTTSWAAC